MRFMDTDKQEIVKIHLRNLQSQMTEVYEKIIVIDNHPPYMVGSGNEQEVVDEFETLAEQFHKDDFDMRQLGMTGCIYDDVCPEYVVCCCNWCSALGLWNQELRKAERKYNGTS